MFDLYYKLTKIVDREEWNDFADSLRRPLPVTFRFVAGAAPPAFRAKGEAILERDRELAGDINPMLARHGESSEARQYSGRAVDDGWTCPFRDPRSEKS